MSIFSDGGEPLPPLSLAGGAQDGREPFLATGGLFALAVAPPALTLLLAQTGTTLPRFGDAIGCLAATWIATLAVGLLVHGAVNRVAPVLHTRVRSTAVAWAGIVGVTLFTALASLLVVLPMLRGLSRHVSEDRLGLTARGVALALLYVVGNRLFTVVTAQSQRQQARLRASEARAHTARLAMLQAQLNPHFLFNTLNSIASLIPVQPDLAEATIERLAGVLQYMLAAGERSSVTLGEELASVRDYLGIVEARFGDRIRSRIDMGEALLELQLPPMLLQPLIENAVLHGLASRAEGGEICIDGRAHDGSVHVTISDNGVGPGKSTRRGARMALKNIRERLALTYGTEASLEVRAREGGGCQCELSLPLLQPGVT